MLDFLGAVPEDYFSMVFEEKNWKWRNHHVTRMRLDFFKSKMNHDKKDDDRWSLMKHYISELDN